VESVSERTIDTRIKRLLRDHPRGLTTTAIAKRVGMNRNSTAKHLEVLQAMGNVESTTYGSAKVYFYPGASRHQRSSIWPAISSALSMNGTILL
jgi:predicted ArsR family transcriptional regulator